MANILLEINGEKESFNRLWVHLQDDERRSPRDFTIRIPNENLYSIFDPYGLKPVDQLWSEHIWNQIKDLGTFIIEAYIKNIRRILNDTDISYSWVLSSIKEIRDTENGIEIQGRVVPFSPRNYV
jgi:hypothetical protein